MQNLLKQAADKIASAKNPVSFSGAGLSAESGIATFRAASRDVTHDASGDGSAEDKEALWDRFDPMKMASQEGFAAAPEAVIDWYNVRRKTLADASPNAAHHALAHTHGWVHITQNVDNLLEAAGADDESVFHLHGTLLQDHCNNICGHTEVIDLQQPPPLRKCQCGGTMRPSVVWFGEALPEAVMRQALSATEKADLMLVVGTSAQVYPAAGLIDIAARNGADIVVVNTESSGEKTPGVIELIGLAGVVLPELLA